MNHEAYDNNNDDLCLFKRLPDEIVLEILRRLFDLKTLCICYVVCKRFSLIVVQVDTIFLAIPVDLGLDDDGVSIDDVKDCFKCESFNSRIKSLNKFTCLKSFSLNLLFPSQEQDNRYMFRWKVNVKNDKFDSFLCISPTSLYRCNTNEEEEEEQQQDYEATKKKYNISFKCLWDAIMRVIMLFDLMETFPLLEKVSITDSAKMGTVSLGATKIAKMRSWLLSPSGTIDQKLKQWEDRRCWVSWCYVPLLELPVSGYLMKGVTLIILHTKNDRPVNIDFDDDFEDTEKIVYNEAVTKIFNKHMGLIKTRRVV